MGGMLDWIGALWQWQFPAPLRITERDASSSTVQLADLVVDLADRLKNDEATRTAAITRLEAQVAALEQSQSDGGERSKEADLFTSRLATAVWRLRQAAGRLDSVGPGRALRNRVDALDDLLTRQRIEIEDFSGTAYDPAELWDTVIGDESAKSRPVIASMQSPRVRWNGRILQRGTPVVEEGRQL